MLVQLNSGKVLNGSILSESADGFDLMMADGNRETLKNSDIKKKVKTNQSLMPDGLTTTLSTDEFVDLITYIVSLKK
jgi:putative heme-binding domain-containing protein